MVRKPEGKTPFGRPRLRWEGMNNICLKERGWEFVGWIHLTQNRDLTLILLNTVMNSRRMRNIFCLADQLLNSEGLRVELLDWLSVGRLVVWLVGDSVGRAVSQSVLA